MAIGTLAAMGISAGASLLGKGANAIFNDRPDIPDFTSEVAGQFDEAQRSLSRKQDRQTNQVQADATAAGVNPVSAMADVIESNNQAQADLQAKEADAMAAAENKEKQMKYGRARQKYQSRAQGIGSLVNAVSTGVSNKAALNAIEGMEEDKKGGGEGEGGGQGSSGGSASSAASVGNNVGSQSGVGGGPTTANGRFTDPSLYGSGNEGTGEGIGGETLSILSEMMGGQMGPLFEQLAADKMDGSGMPEEMSFGIGSY
jgi:hypothetical protein